MNKKVIKRKLIQYSYIALGVILLNLGFYFFIDSTGIIIGGLMGLSTILKDYYSLLGSWFTSSLFILIGNTIALIVGGITLGKDFFLKTIFSTFFSPLVLFVLERAFPDPNFFMKTVSESGHYIVALVCGCLLEGLGLGIALKNNGSTGGLDVIQKMMSKYLHIPYSKTMYLTDLLIVILSGLSFNQGFSYHIEFVMYGSVGVFAVSIIIDTIVLDVRRRRTAYIITDKPEEIKQMIYEKINRGVTFVNAIGGYSKKEKTMLICTMEKAEAYKIMELLKEIDPATFCYVSSTSEIVGEYIR